MIWKRYALVFVVGLLSPVLLGVYAGGESITQLGLRMTAFEQGVALASRHHSWIAAADAEAMPVEMASMKPVAMRAAPKKTAKVR